MARLLDQIGGMLALNLLFAVPIVAAGWWLLRVKRRYHREAVEPFTDLPLRSPGESLRVTIEQLDEKFMDHVLVMCLPLVIAGLLSVSAELRSPWVIGGFWLVSVGIVFVWGRKLVRLAKQRRKLQLAFTGERLVGEYLNQLIRDGFDVFHDVPFDGFNIDHVLVGPAGVYAVETKTRRKPLDADGRKQWMVEFDGEALHWPRWKNDRKPIEQARRNAAALREWLSSAAGENVPVSAMVVIPGWDVARRARGDVNVLNPKEVRRSFPDRPREPLSPAQIKRIVHQLEQKCLTAAAPLALASISKASRSYSDRAVRRRNNWLPLTR